ncbi:hypothetical protein X961_6106 [Burkholderia pseudomallei MSHR5613]|nr:hypothetical protein X961_6106 [Burkholderia pseudomallei MSHR5613]
MASEGTLSIRRAKHVTTRAALVARQELAIDRDSDSGADRARRGAAKERGDDRAGETPEDGAGRTGDDAGHRLRFCTGECHGDTARCAEDAADRAASLAGAVACVDTRRLTAGTGWHCRGRFRCR